MLMRLLAFQGIANEREQNPPDIAPLSFSELTRPQRLLHVINLTFLRLLSGAKS